MDDKKRKLTLIAGGAIALVILGVVLYTFLGGEEEPPAPPPPPAAVEELSETAPPAQAVVPEPVKKLTELITEGRTTLQQIAAREDVYGDAGAWWTLFAANPESVRYLFRDEIGEFTALIPSGTHLVIPEKREVSAAEQAKLQRGFGAYAVQFGSYTEAANATDLMNALERGEPGMDFYVSNLTVDGVPRRRIRAGLFSRWADAERYGRSINQRYEEVQDYYVVKVPVPERRAQERALRKRYR